MSRYLAIFVVLMLAGCTAAQIKPSILLEPATFDAEATPTIHLVDSTGNLADVIGVGDKLIAVGNQDIESYIELGQLFSEAGTFDLQATIMKADGRVFTAPMEAVFPGMDGVTQAAWVPSGSTAFSGMFINPDGDTQISGGVYAGNIYAALAARLWQTMPQLLELQLSITASPECNDCGLTGVGVLDMPHNSWIQPISMEHVAWAVLPNVGEPGQVVAVPAPTPAGGTSFSNTTGTWDAYTYGNNTSGVFNANTTTTYAPRYDYTATNAAQFHNLGVALRNERIANQNTARYEFVAKRSGNLRLGQMGPGETFIGHVFYALPAGFSGPFAVQVVNTTGDFGWLRFDAANN